MNASRAKEALEKWQSAVNQWKQSSPKPQLCHPWSEQDFQRRLETFAEVNVESVGLAADGFEKARDDGVIRCALCGVSVSTLLRRPEHKDLCPWKGRPYAKLKANWNGQYSPAENNNNVFDNTRHALGSIENVRQVMETFIPKPM